MNLIEFSNWLITNGYNKKIASDIISRLKRIDKELLYSKKQTTIDNEYLFDSCENLLKSLIKNQKSDEYVLKNSNLPVNKYEIYNYKFALNKYLSYLKTKKTIYKYLETVKILCKVLINL